MGKKVITAKEFREMVKPKRKLKKKLRVSVNTEEQDQTAICNYIKVRYPKILYTVDMAGVYIKDPSQRRIHKQRCKRGHPDMIIQEWLSDKYCGLAIELKKSDIVINQKAIDKSNHLKEQLEYLNDLRERCYIAVFVSGFANAKKVIDLYLEGDLSKIEEINKYVYPEIKI